MQFAQMFFVSTHSSAPSLTNAASCLASAAAASFNSRFLHSFTALSLCIYERGNEGCAELLLLQRAEKNNIRANNSYLVDSAQLPPTYVVSIPRNQSSDGYCRMLGFNFVFSLGLKILYYILNTFFVDFSIASSRSRSTTAQLTIRSYIITITVDIDNAHECCYYRLIIISAQYSLILWQQ